MSDDLAEFFGPISMGVAAGMGTAALLYAASGDRWMGSAIAAAVSLLIGLVCLLWSTR